MMQPAKDYDNQFHLLVNEIAFALPGHTVLQEKGFCTIMIDNIFIDYHPNLEFPWGIYFSGDFGPDLRSPNVKSLINVFQLKFGLIK